VFCMQWKSVLEERFLNAVGFVFRLGLWGGGGESSKEGRVPP